MNTVIHVFHTGTEEFIINLGNVWPSKRKLYSRDQLAQSRILHLNSIGFVWNVHHDRREETFQLLLGYKQEHGDTLVLFNHRVIHDQLGMWVNTQRQQYRKERLAQSRLQRLNSIKFLGNLPKNDRWEEMFQLLLEHKRIKRCASYAVIGANCAWLTLRHGRRRMIDLPLRFQGTANGKD